MDLPFADVLMRYAHFLFALIWLGHNYANVVQNPCFKPFNSETSEDAKTSALEKRMKKEHGIFRYASIFVWLSGVGLLWYRGWLVDAFTLQGSLAAIGMGAWIGTLMMLNLWFIMWPHQKKVLGFVPASLEERVRCSRITFLSSRTNSILSIPLLFFMASGHDLQIFL